MTAILRSRITPIQFVETWKPVQLTERAAAQSHFNDLCDLLDHPRPLDVDPKGEWFTFEKGVKKAGGGDGFADVWKRANFAWEYKKKKRNLDEALGQLSRYALALENPPLHIVCDTERFRIVTAWTNTVPKPYELGLNDILEPEKLAWLRSAFHDPDALRPGGLRSDLTKKAANSFSDIAFRLRGRGHSPEAVAHFVNRLTFLFFAEDVKLLPHGYFRRVLGEMSLRPSEAEGLLSALFTVLHKGGRFGLDRLPQVNGGLFEDGASLPLCAEDIALLLEAAKEDWAHIDPSIFGTLFERFLDPEKRSQIGAHYTDIEKITRIIEPVVMRPLRREWETARNEIAKLVSKAKSSARTSKKYWQEAEKVRSIFVERLRTFSVLDPACGSGNFLYVALREIKGLEHSANQECEALGLEPRWPVVGPEILHGIEINPIAADLARTTIWIGDIQWGVQNGFNTRPEPILRSLELIENRDALINDDGSEAVWPGAQVIVGNPPFLGVRRMPETLGDDYVRKLRHLYKGRVSATSDLVCWWFEKSRSQILSGRTKRAGLVSTNSIRKGQNRATLDRIATDTHIVNAYSDEPWIADGAAVRVSMVCFGSEAGVCELDGKIVPSINAELTADIDGVFQASRLEQNRGVSFIGVQKNGKFDIAGDIAREWVAMPENPNGRHNADVLKLTMSGRDIVEPGRDRWIVDFSAFKVESDAALFAAPFSYVLKNVKPDRDNQNRMSRKKNWWLFGEVMPAMRAAIHPLRRYIGTSLTSKHRIFCWISQPCLLDSTCVVIAKDDDYTFGIMHSRFHVAWSVACGNWLGVGNDSRYTPTTTFETFPFPSGLTPDKSPAQISSNPVTTQVAEKAMRLNDLRRNWQFPNSLIRIVPECLPEYPSRILPVDANAAIEIRKRSLTDLYNERPTWLDNAHRDLDRAVAAAYGWSEDISTEDALAALLELNRERAAAQGKA